jgi:hypothetical protein
MRVTTTALALLLFALMVLPAAASPLAHAGTPAVAGARVEGVIECEGDSWIGYAHRRNGLPVDPTWDPYLQVGAVGQTTCRAEANTVPPDLDFSSAYWVYFCPDHELDSPVPMNPWVTELSSECKPLGSSAKSETVRATFEGGPDAEDVAEMLACLKVRPPPRALACEAALLFADTATWSWKSRDWFVSHCGHCTQGHVIVKGFHLISLPPDSKWVVQGCLPLDFNYLCTSWGWHFVLGNPWDEEEELEEEIEEEVEPWLERCPPRCRGVHVGVPEVALP